MRYQTALMRAILTNETAQELIDYVSQIYGNSYVALWIFQVVGEALGEVLEYAADLRAETNPSTADVLLDYWEAWYGLPENPTLTTAQRQSRIRTKISTRANMNPDRLAAAVSSALGGVRVVVDETPGSHQFTISVLDGLPSAAAAAEIIRQLKPAHLLADCVFRYLRIFEIHEAKTLTEMDELKLGQFEGG